MKKLDEYRTRLMALDGVHKQLWREHGLLDVRTYDDRENLRKYGTVVMVQVQDLYDGWLDLRRDMEQFLERKSLPLDYPERVWTNYIIGSQGGSMNYDGSFDVRRFDSGPAFWCARTLVGMTDEMYRRRQMHMIEMFSVGGFVMGFIGVAVGIIGLM